MSAEELFQTAVRYRDRGEHDKALRVLQSAEQELSGFAGYHAVLAHVLWQLGRLEDAIRKFRCGTNVAPRSEAISLGLFHCLWEHGDIDNAFDEMRRFLSVADSGEYRRIINDINSSGD